MYYILAINEKKHLIYNYRVYILASTYIVNIA